MKRTKELINDVVAMGFNYDEIIDGFKCVIEGYYSIY